MSQPENWIVYPIEIDDDAGLVTVNIALADSAPDRERPLALCVRIPFADTDDPSESHDAEFEAICDIEDQLVEQLAERHQGICVGRVRLAGMIDLWFYLKPGTEEAVEALVRESFAKTGCELNIGEDVDWDVYQEQLLPDPSEMQWALDQQLVDTFEEMGDDLSVERPVRFISYFENKPSAESFARLAESAGFEQAGTAPTEFDPSLIEVTLVRTTPIEFESVHPLSLTLMELAEQHDGEFDGWEAQPVSAMKD